MRENAWASELEADRYAGAALRRIAGQQTFFREGKGGIVQEAIGAAVRIFSIEGSATHPPRDQRIAAMIEGYTNGSPCSSLGIVKPYPLPESH
jgi:hypothetical protein